VVRSIVAPRDRVAKLLLMFLQGLGRAVDSGTARFRRITRPNVGTVEN
jgi:hypothetical protein